MYNLWLRQNNCCIRLSSYRSGIKGQTTIAALDYHHIDPASKDKRLSIAMRNGYAWSRIVEEARKCTILCCRCHREIHAGVTELPHDCARFNEEYANAIKTPVRKYDTCKCGKKKEACRKFCSVNCSNESFKKFDITKKELEELIANNSYVAVGKMFNVSDNAIKKRCKSLGILLKPRKASKV